MSGKESSWSEVDSVSLSIPESVASEPGKPQAPPQAPRQPQAPSEVTARSAFSFHADGRSNVSKGSWMDVGTSIPEGEEAPPPQAPQPQVLHPQAQSELTASFGAGLSARVRYPGVGRLIALRVRLPCVGVLCLALAIAM